LAIVRINGYELKGHEFHYSQYIAPAPTDPVFLEPGMLASYTHFYWGEDPAALYSWLG
jgi:cobyrinic acid a,c-diamide synthase